MAPQLRQVI
jgi:hypothetical protein